MKKLLLFFIFTFFLQTAQAQNKRVLDSLQVVYKNTKHDTSKILVLLEIAQIYKVNKSDSCIALAEKALAQSRYLSFKKGIAESYYVLGMGNQYNNYYELAVQNYQESIRYREELGDNKGIGILLRSIAALYRNRSMYALSMEYYQKFIKHAEQNHDQKSIAEALNAIGLVYVNQANYLLGLECYQKALKISEEIDDKKGVSRCLTNLGNVYLDQGNYDLALKYYEKSLEINEALKIPQNIATSYNNIAEIYQYRKNYTKALEYYELSLAINKKTRNKLTTSMNLYNIGNIHHAQGKVTQALGYYEESLKLRQEAQDRKRTGESLLAIANVYKSMKEYDKSLAYARQALAIADEFQIPELKGNITQKLYEIYKLLKNNTQALEYYELSRQIQDSLFSIEKSKAISTLTSTMELERKQKAYILLEKDNEINKVSADRNRLEADRVARELEIKEKQGEADRLFALAKQEKDKRKSDSLYNIAKTKQLEVDNLVMKDEKATLQMKKQEEATGFQRVIIYLILAGLAAVLILAFFIYRSRQAQKNLNVQLSEKATELTTAYHELQCTNEELHQSQEEIIAQRDHIEEQNKDLAYQNTQTKHSITTALAIQKALLPFENRVRGILKDYFVLYQPRDIVSGDFYWIEKLDNQVIVIAGDCTGHGVPGAFMSLIAINLLEKIVLQDKITSPSQILRNLHDLVRSSLKQDEIDNQSGMDLGIVTITNGNTLHFSGAKRPLYFIDSSNPTEVRVCGGSRKSIGGLQNEAKEFEEVMLVLPTESMFYLSSDGLADQNNVKRKRLKEEPVLEILLATYGQPLKNQRLALSQLLENHMIGTEQRDDILLLGVKI